MYDEPNDNPSQSSPSPEIGMSHSFSSSPFGSGSPNPTSRVLIEQESVYAIISDSEVPSGVSESNTLISISLGPPVFSSTSA